MHGSGTYTARRLGSIYAGVCLIVLFLSDS
jgi:hypothetical protein